MEHTVSYIHALGRFSGKAGLHRIKALMQALGNPQDKLQFVHLAGTNGKGSTAAMIAQIVQTAGYRVGLFTSPYLVQFHERIRVNGTMIADADLTRLTERIAAAKDTLSLPEGEHIGEFEFVTAVGMLYFVEQNCDLVVLETGLGGAFDASNCIAPPLAAVITAISLDHTAVLGHTLTEIAQTKAGIIKTGSTVICMPQQAEAYRVIEKVCTEKQVPCIVPQEPNVLSCDLTGSKIQYRDAVYEIHMLGRHQIQNAVTALETIAVLQQKGFAISLAHCQAGLAQTKFAGRLECISRKPLILLDGAHNPDGVQKLCDAIEELFQNRRILLIVGMVRDKAVETCVQSLAAHAAQIFTAAPHNERALDSAKLAEIARQTCPNVTDCKDIQTALAKAVQSAAENDCILICGSLYLVGEAKKYENADII